MGHVTSRCSVILTSCPAGPGPSSGSGNPLRVMIIIQHTQFLAQITHILYLESVLELVNELPQ